MRKIILNLAMSLDGYIADSDGGYDWIVGDGSDCLNTEEKFDFNSFLKSVDLIVMGRKAYDETPKDSFPNHKIMVMTREKRMNHDNVVYMSGDIKKILGEERLLSGQSIYLFGGGVLIEPLLSSGMIDEYMIGIVPCVLGKGRKLFLSEHPSIRLKLKKYYTEQGMVILHYEKEKL